MWKQSYRGEVGKADVLADARQEAGITFAGELKPEEEWLGSGGTSSSGTEN